MLLIGKPSISMGHLYHGYVSHNQRVDLFVCCFDKFSNFCVKIPQKSHPSRSHLPKTKGTSSRGRCAAGDNGGAPRPWFWGEPTMMGQKGV